MYKFFLSALVFCLRFTLLEAREPYHATVTVGAESALVSEPNLVDLSRNLKTTSLEDLLPSYTPTTATSLDFNLRGIFALSSFAANSTTLNVSIPQAGLIESFTGVTRDDSIKLFKDFLRDNGRHHRLLKAYARYSPIDPIAGNPNSLMAAMADANYWLGQLSPLSPCGSYAQPIVSQFQKGALITRGFSGGFDATTVTVPFRYTYSPDFSKALIVDFPFTYIRNGGASSVYMSIGLGARLPVTCNWALTPIFRAGSGGSLDLCACGNFINAGVTSTYDLKWCDFVFTAINYAGYSTTTNFWLTGVNFNYNLHNYVFKNGLSVTSCTGFTFCERPLNISLYIVDSYFSREQLYIRHYDEVGFSLITTDIIPYFCYDCLSLTFAYQFGQKSYKGYNFKCIYQF